MSGQGTGEGEGLLSWPPVHLSVWSLRIVGSCPPHPLPAMHTDAGMGDYRSCLIRVKMVLKRGNPTPSNPRGNPSMTLNPHIPSSCRGLLGVGRRGKACGENLRQCRRGSGISAPEGPQTLQPLGTLAFGGTFPPRDFIPALFKAPGLFITQVGFEVLGNHGIAPPCRPPSSSAPGLLRGWLPGSRSRCIYLYLDKTSIAHLALLGVLPSRAFWRLFILS